jgi:hypothetical protein
MFVFEFFLYSLRSRIVTKQLTNLFFIQTTPGHQRRENPTQLTRNRLRRKSAPTPRLRRSRQILPRHHRRSQKSSQRN